MSNYSSHSLKSAIAVVAAALTGCSIHPIPDDVSRYSTEEIVRNVRCEAKEAVRDRIQQGLLKFGLVNLNPEKVLADKKSFDIIRRTDRELAEKFIAYGASTITYNFEFVINENNDNDGAVTFGLPLVGGSKFSLALEGELKKERKVRRTFQTLEKFQDLVDLRCGDWVQPARNYLYPLTGSIGVGRLITTFIETAELGHGKGNFADEITFTTNVRASIKPTVELMPITDRFRVTHANANFTNKRDDMHKVTVTLSFPDLKRVQAVRALSTDLISVFSRDTEDSAVINSCIAVEEGREDRFGTLRQLAPKYYCRLNGMKPPL